MIFWFFLVSVAIFHFFLSSSKYGHSLRLPLVFHCLYSWVATSFKWLLNIEFQPFLRLSANLHIKLPSGLFSSNLPVSVITKTSVKPNLPGFSPVCLNFHVIVIAFYLVFLPLIFNIFTLFFIHQVVESLGSMAS